RPPTDRQAALQRAVGQTLAFVRQRAGGGADTVRASVVRTDPAQYRLPDGRLLLDDPGEPLFPAELVRTAPDVTVVLDAARDRPRTELAYVTEGTTWEALYQVVVGGVGSGSVTGTATLRSQALRADSADGQRVAGTLRGRGFVGQTPGEDNRVPVQVWYTLKRGRGTPFGDRPLPGGTVQLYQADSAGRLQLVGEARSEHTAPGRDLRVQSGDAFDITAERVQTDYAQEQLAPPKRGMAPRQRI